MKRKCDCAPIFRPELRPTGELDPPRPGYYCNVCKKQWHQWRLSAQYIKEIKNVAKSWRYSKKPTFEYELQTAKEFQRVMEMLEIKKITVNAKGEYSCSF